MSEKTMTIDDLKAHFRNMYGNEVDIDDLCDELELLSDAIIDGAQRPMRFKSVGHGQYALISRLTEKCIPPKLFKCDWVELARHAEMPCEFIEETNDDQH